MLPCTFFIDYLIHSLKSSLSAFTFLFALNFFGAKLCDYDSFVLNFMANGCNVLLSFQLFSTHL